MTTNRQKTWKENLWVLYRFLARLRMLVVRDRVYESPEGDRYWINRYSYVERCISEGGFEKRRVAFLRSQLEPKDVFIDIGANIGLFTIIAGRRGSRIEAFEPDSLNRARLLRNLQLNRFSDEQIKVHDCALGSETGEVTLRRPLSDNYGRSSIVTIDSPDGVRVPLRRFDEVVSLSPDQRQVLDGARESLQKMKAGSLWIVEVHESEGGQAQRGRRTFSAIRVWHHLF